MVDINKILLSAAKIGETDVVVACLQRGADINYKGQDSSTPCSVAGHDRIVEILVKGGGDINVQDREGQTALHRAAERGHARIVKILVEGGGDVNVQDRGGWTALHWAAWGGHARIVKILMEGGGDINVQDREGRTALHIAARWGHDRIIEILVEGGGDINVQDYTGGKTALHLAAGRGHVRIVKILVEGGGDINVQDNSGQTALHLAADCGHARIVKILEEGGGDINVQDIEGSTPLHLSFKKESQLPADVRDRTAAVLVQLGSDMSLKDNEGKTPLDYCKENTKRSLQGYASQVMTAFPQITDGKEFQNLLSKGFYFSYNNRVYLAGACNVGKSTLASILIGVKISKDWISTDGLKIYFGKNGIDLKKKEMVVISKALQDNILTSILLGEPSLDPTPAVRNRSLIESLKLLFKKRPQKSIQTQPSKIASPQVLSKAMQSSQDIPKIDPSHSAYQHSVMGQEQHQKDLKHHKPSYKQSLAVIQKNLKDEIRRGKYKVSIAPSDLVDFGGQKAFDLTHQLFIQQKGAFVLLIDGRKHLDDALPEYKDVKMTTRMILLHWVNSILTYCTTDNDDIYPLIVFALTHKDELTKVFPLIKKDIKRLFTDCLDGIPEDKHLIRLAKRVVKKFYDFIIHLGLTTDKWEDIENNTTYPDRLTKRFIALCECKNQRRTFRDFAKALTDSECSEHFLCQVFIEGCKEVLDNATVNLQESPEDNVLEELSEQIGNCAMPLGVELGLKLPIIDHIIYANIKNMFGQNLGVLYEWKRRSNNPTIMFLMKALHQADKRGLNFLIEKYK